MRILIVANYKPDQSGISAVVASHYYNLDREKIQVSLFNTKRNRLKRLFLIFSLISQARKHDLLHIHGCSGLGFFPVIVGVLAGKIFLNKKTLISFHGGGAREFLQKNSWWIKWFLQKADHVTVMSEHFRRVFLDFGIETSLLRNIIDIEMGLERTLNLSRPEIISVRSLTSNYNVGDIIEAFKTIKSHYPEASLKIAGTGDEMFKLVELSAELEGIEFLGMIPNEKVRLLLKSSNVFISVPSVDNQPVSILEAFSCGVPVIAAKVGGIADLIEDNRNGFLVESHNPRQIAEKVDLIMKNQELVEKVVAAGRKKVEKHLWNSIKPDLFKLYGLN